MRNASTTRMAAAASEVSSVASVASSNRLTTRCTVSLSIMVDFTAICSVFEKMNRNRKNWVREVTRWIELDEEEIDGFVLVGAFEARCEGEDLVQSVDFEVVASYLTLPLNLFPHWSIHFFFSLSHTHSLLNRIRGLGLAAWRRKKNKKPLFRKKWRENEGNE